MRKFKPDQPITTRDGLYEAIHDVMREEGFTEGFTLKQMRERLPYGRRVDNMINWMVIRGEVRRVAPGEYKLITR